MCCVAQYPLGAPAAFRHALFASWFHLLLQIFSGTYALHSRGCELLRQIHKTLASCPLYEGQEIETQEAPPRASVVRDSGAKDDYKNRTRFMERVEACLPSARIGPKQRVTEPRRLTPRMQAYWEAIHAAKCRSLTQREIAGELGISRSTVVRYVKLDKPPVYGEGSREEDKGRGLTESLFSSR